MKKFKSAEEMENYLLLLQEEAKKSNVRMAELEKEIEELKKRINDEENRETDIDEFFFGGRTEEPEPE